MEHPTLETGFCRYQRLGKEIDMTVGIVQPARHILSLSGGKDSTALAIFMRDRIPEMEYVFCDTEQELPETMEYLDRLEVYLGKTIKKLKHDGKGFDELLQARRGFFAICSG
jgi:3'-phosphoadenosine 5'-phosphosulfate sulfotransferase (PAPS reductase)/FAD synthetase